MFGQAYTIEDAAGGARLTVRGTRAGVEPPALVLEVLFTGPGDHGWLDALAPVEKRFEVLHGDVEINGVRLAPGDRLVVAVSERVKLGGAIGAQLVCDLRPAGDPVALAEALRRASAERGGRRRPSLRAPAALALSAALLVGLTVAHRPTPAHAKPGHAAWSEQLHLGG
jgi:hypothetical protein